MPPTRDGLGHIGRRDTEIVTTDTVEICTYNSAFITQATPFLLVTRFHDRGSVMSPVRMIVIALAAALVTSACTAAGAGPGQVLDPDAAVAMMERDDVVIIDVRTPGEYAEGHVDGAVLINIQAADFLERVDALDRDTTYVIYCRTGNRSAAAIQAMTDLGFTSLYDARGFADLARAGAATAMP